MIAGEALRMATRALREHKVRSALTLTGVVVGIASVITIVTLGASFEASVVAQFDDVSDRSVFVNPTQEDGPPGPPDAGQFGTLFTQVDVDALGRIDGVQQVVPSGSVPVTGLVAENQRIPFRELTATRPDAQMLQGAVYQSGSSFSSGETEAVLSAQVAEQLEIEAGDEVTATASEANATLTVAGVLSPDASNFGPAENGVFVPLDPFYNKTTESPSTGEIVPVYDSLTVVSTSPQRAQEVRDSVEAYVSEDSDASRLAPEGIVIGVATTSDIVDAIGQTFDRVTLFVAAVAFVSLVVGAIGIANIMLVSVVERTEEIGIMRAMGALDRDILAIFLTEAALIGLAGTIVGVFVGLGAGAALVEALFSDAPFSIPWDWLALVVPVGVGTGIVAGYLPARRATRIDPVDALTGT